MSNISAKDFWTWFSENEKQYLFLRDIEEQERNKLLNILIDKLHEYNEHLFFEIGGNPSDEKLDFIVSAGGIVDFFALVDELVNEAPNYDNWHIIAFKPPMPEDHTIEINGKSFDAKTIICLPLENAAEPNAVAVRVCYADLTEEDRDVYINATFLLLDALIGEKATALEIDHIEIEKTPTDIADYPFIHLNDIGHYIKEKKNVANN